MVAARVLDQMPMPDLHLRLEADDAEAAVPRPVLSEEDALAMLERAEITAAKLVPWGSNYTFAISLTDESGRDHLGIYKPQAGERPLWDFPTGTLYRREYASYVLSRWLGWNLVPPTVVRDGPHGPGSVQLYVEPTEEEIEPHEFWGRCLPEIERMVMFDHVANNADRKIGHCLVDVHGRIWGIDHGLTFNVDPKLRTVLWQYAGSVISEELREDVRRLIDPDAEIYTLLKPLLAADELAALRSRARLLAHSGRYPLLDPHYNVPYGWW